MNWKQRSCPYLYLGLIDGIAASWGEDKCSG